MATLRRVWSNTENVPDRWADASANLTPPSTLRDVSGFGRGEADDAERAAEGGRVAGVQRDPRHDVECRADPRRDAVERPVGSGLQLTELEAGDPQRAGQVQRPVGRLVLNIAGDRLVAICGGPTQHGRGRDRRGRAVGEMIGGISEVHRAQRHAGEAQPGEEASMVEVEPTQELMLAAQNVDLGLRFASKVPSRVLLLRKIANTW